MAKNGKSHHDTKETTVKSGTPRASRGPQREQDEWLTVDEVCTELKVSRRTFDRWRALGTGPRAKRLNGTGPVRVRRSWLDEWLNATDEDIA
jgi:excisionase family DNA binding protein